MRFIYDWHLFIEDISHSKVNSTKQVLYVHKFERLPFVQRTENSIFLRINFVLWMSFFRDALNFVRTNSISFWLNHMENEFCQAKSLLNVYRLEFICNYTQRKLLKMICAWINSINYNKTRLIIIFNDDNNFRPTNFHFELHSFKWNGQHQAHVFFFLCLSHERYIQNNGSLIYPYSLNIKNLWYTIKLNYKL